MYTIYIKQSSIQIRVLPTHSEVLATIVHEENGAEVLFVEDDYDFISTIKGIIIAGKTIRINIYHKNPKSLFKKLKDSVHYIKAGGGLIRNEKKQYLFIFRNGIWDLPKGKLEPHEDIQQCALREVQEETGVVISLVKKELISTYHIYEMEGELVLKRTYWFLMKAKEEQNLIPQKEEGIEEIRWVSKYDFSLIQANTYPSILEVIDTLMN